MSEVALFIGKGGVGKTTISAAYATHRAAQLARRNGGRVLLLSTDPAHSLADIFETKLGDSPQRAGVWLKAHLDLWQVDANRQFRRFLNHYKEKLLSVLEAGSIFTRADLEPLLETSLPGMAELGGLLAISDTLNSRKYAQIVVDTAPMGHTLRLFALPQYFSSFLKLLELAANRDRVLAERFGGQVQPAANLVVAQWHAILDRVRAALVERAKIFLVTTPEKFSLNESRRAVDALHAISAELKVSAIVLNRAVLRRSKCRICRAKRTATERARKFVRRQFAPKEFYIAEDTGAPVMGERLGAFGQHVFAGKPFLWNKRRAPKNRGQSFSRAEWPMLAQPLTMVVGKGGVGKTTVAAALGFNHRLHASCEVDICSVDPAPSLDDVFGGPVSDVPRGVMGDRKLRASEMDAVAIFRAWAGRMKKTIEEATTSEISRVHVDLWFERQLFSQLLESVPPGLDEILAVLQVLEMLQVRGRRLLIDMAPTGHALELLRTPERILVWTRLLLKTLARHRTLPLAQDAGCRSPNSKIVSASFRVF